MNAFWLWLVVVVTYCHTTFALWPENPFEAVNYLLRYGYLNPDYSMRTNPTRFLHYAVKNFQRKSMIRVTGEIDESTLHQMQRKRCGVPDFSREKIKRIFHTTEIRFVLSKRDATQAHWNKTDLTYYIKNYTPDLSKEQTDETIKSALQVWADVSKLTFRQMNDESADIVIEFATWDHGDGVPFDGPGGTLAHAYFPETNENPIEGDAHFDGDETWMLEDSQNGTNLFCTAVHEFGHSLGLSHTYNSKDIMYPFETGCDDFRLSESDIYAIQQLYGKPDNPVTMLTKSSTEKQSSTQETTKINTKPPTPPTTEEPLTTSTSVTPPSTSLKIGTTTQEKITTSRPIVPFPELCEGFIDAITYGADENLYVFVDFLVFMYDAYGARQDYYTFISDVFPHGPSSIDAAFTLNLNDYGQKGHTSFTYLIKDPNIWKYYYHDGHEQFQLAVGYPKHKEKDFPHAPRFIRAAFYINRKTYLIDRDYYVEYHYDCEASTFESLTYTTAFRASKYFRNFPKDTYIDAVSRSGDDYVNVFLKNDWYIIDPFGEITEKLKTTSFFGCEEIIVPDKRKHSPHRGRHSPHRGRHSPHRGRHSPHRGRHSPHRGRHSPHRGRHSPHRGRHSPHRGKHSHKKHRGSRKRRSRRHRH